jgi:ABC-type antimicrobial peptide transport system permease subunit
MVAIGVIAGVGGALALGRLVANMLYGLKAWDPATFVGSATLLILVAFGASWIPARRAASVDPMSALRHEYPSLGSAQQRTVIAGRPSRPHVTALGN